MAKSIEYKNFFELINPNNEPVVAAVFSSYGFDAELFEKHILPDLLSVDGNISENERYFRNRIALRLREVPVTVFSDASQYHGGRTFLYEHITVNGVTFHPKCHLILFRDHLRIIVGSCNITKSGLCYNAETVWFQDIYIGEGSTLTSDIEEVTNWLMVNYAPNDDALIEISRFLSEQSNIVGYPRLVYTMNPISPYQQFINALKNQNEKLKVLTIISPFYENDRDKSIDQSMLMRFIDEIFTNNKEATIKFFFPAELDANNKYKVTAPVNIISELISKHPRTELYVVNNLWDRVGDAPVPRMLHAKMIIASLGRGQGLTMSGSTNFTRSAMMSSVDNLNNVEISVLEYGRVDIATPPSTRVSINQLIYQQREPSDEVGTNIFINDAVVDADKLVISVDWRKATFPFTLVYQGIVKKTVTSPSEASDVLEIWPFRIAKSMDLRVICEEYEFFYPIRVINKLEYITDDMKLDFSVKMSDVIDYWAGKYKSIQEMKRVIELRNSNPELVANMNAIYFRHNLQRYFKALKTIKNGLEEPFYSETSFNSYITDVFGIKAILDFIIKDYEEQVSVDSETFVLLIEFKHIISNLRFKDDRLAEDFKRERLSEVFQEANGILYSIYSKASRKMKAQYKVILDTYGLVLRNEKSKSN